VRTKTLFVPDVSLMSWQSPVPALPRPVGGLQRERERERELE
jgi:hypothetical protein